MPGRRISIHQIRLYMQSCKEGKTKKTAAAIAGFSERSSYNLENRQLQPRKKERNWRTRPDPFKSVWESELVPKLEANPGLQARTLLEDLQRRHEGKYPDSLLRTLQRKVKKWRALSGPEKEVIFRQKQPPGWQGISDFTNANGLKVTIRSVAFAHLLYHYRLPFSGWEYGQVILGGESYTALAEGLQNAFWASGGVPETHRTDSLSAAYKNFSDKEKEEFTDSYSELCAHYGTEPTRNNKGVSHENGSIESSHRHLKNRIDQALMLRGSRDFDSVRAYKNFVSEVMWEINKRIEKRFAEERATLKPLPQHKTTDYTEERVKVTGSSTVSIKSVIYSMPSRLIGMILKVHVYDDRLECYVGGDHALTMKRLRKNKKCLHLIDYRHVVGSLIRKPQAFRHYVYQEDLFPTFAFKKAWEIMDEQLDPRKACSEFVKILYAAATECQDTVNRYLENCLSSNKIPQSYEVKKLFKQSMASPPQLKESCRDLGDYDILLQSNQGGEQ